MPVNENWSYSFYRTVEDYEYGILDEDQFKAALVRLGCPNGYIDWLVYMMTRITND